MTAADPSHSFKQRSLLLRPIPDEVKHKRTRSGCFTCRARRVKCDESRPVCERCRKGGRGCLYPSPITSSSRTGPVLHFQGMISPKTIDIDTASPLDPNTDDEKRGCASPAGRVSLLDGGGGSHHGLSTRCMGDSMCKDIVTETRQTTILWARVVRG